jgi:hypothetical protein
MADDADDTVQIPDEIPATADKPAMVPSARLRAESALKRAAQTEAKSATERATAAEARAKAAEDAAKAAQDLAKEWESKHADLDKSWSSKATDLEKTWTAKEAAWLDERAMFANGITDPEAIDVARTMYNRLPVENRPPFPDQMKAWRDAPDGAPKALRAYFPDVASATAGGGAKAETKAETKAKAASGAAPAGTPATGGNKYTPEQINAAVMRGQQTGDWSEYNAIRPHLLAQISGRQPDPHAKG